MKKVSENLDCVINYANKDSENMCDEPECIKQWNASFCERIRIKDETERAKITEMQEKGMQELHDWGVQYRESLARSVKISRAHEKELLETKRKKEQASSSLSHANASNRFLWESVCQLCNFANGSEDEPISNNILSERHNSKDLSRMRVLLLQLKNDPPIMPTRSVNAH